MRCWAWEGWAHWELDDDTDVWLRKQALEPESRGFELGSGSYQLCDFGQVLPPSKPHLPHPSIGWPQSCPTGDTVRVSGMHVLHTVSAQ